MASTAALWNTQRDKLFMSQTSPHGPPKKEEEEEEEEEREKEKLYLF